MRVRSGILTRLFSPCSSGWLAVDQDALTIRSGAQEHSFTFEAPLDLHERPGLLGSRLGVRAWGANAVVATVVVAGLPRRAVRALRAKVLSRQLAAPVAAANRELRVLFDADRYLNHRAWAAWDARHRPLADRVPTDWEELELDDALRRGITLFLRCLREGETLRGERNARYVERESLAHEAWLNQVERYPLTDRQRLAVVCDEDHTLVVAGAGTGKTSTVVAKVGYVLRKRLAQPGEILLLAFARKAKEEMRERLAARFGVDLEVRTFHALGLEIVAQVEGTRPSLSPLAEDEQRLAKAVEEYLGDLLRYPATRDAVVEFFTWYRYPLASEHDYTTAHDYYQFLKGHDVRTLRGERVKSVGELVVADFLTLNGVAYRYEADYAHPTATADRRQYRPDFYLPDHGVYIEYFGIDRQGKTAPYINAAEYRAGMAWKRDTHEQHGTPLLELFSYELWEGTLRDALRDRLADYGIPLKPVGGEELRALLANSGEASRVAKLLCSFLNLYKSNAWTPAEVRARADTRPDAARCRAFLGVFELVLRRYEAELSQAGHIDFHDMVARATRYAASSAYRSPFRYVLVDEFQDIARGRAALLKALLAQQPDPRLFCVGDDWQSIYRFAGSDVSLMTGFADQFGHAQRIDLDRTFRFRRELLDASTRFVLSNPRQLRKELVAAEDLGVPGVVVLYQGSGEAEASGLRRALDQIERERGDTLTSVKILGRYGFTLPGNLAELRSRYAGLTLDAHTVHGAKGLEADYVVILDVTRGRFGFPTEVSDDPVLGLVLADADTFANAEERRLFYVALTRARRRAYVVTEEGRRSTFVEELGREAYRDLVASEEAGRRVPCPKCTGGSLVMRRGEWGVFWGCSNYPYCDGKAQACPKCGRGVFVREGRRYRCSSDHCDQSAEACPRCVDGMLRWRDGKYGRFLGCSNWRAEGPSCDYTRAPRRRGRH